MSANFKVTTGFTVPANYSWDVGLPLDGSVATIKVADSTQTYISGYAPCLKVIFENASQENFDYPRRNYIWNFGDYYNDINNIVSLSCFSFTEHTYIMPGRYTVSLNLTQTLNDDDTDIIDQNDLICKGKGNVKWFWDNIAETSLNTICIPWSATDCQQFSNFTFVTSGYDKWWDNELNCFQKYCKLWSWSTMRQGYIFSSPRVNPDSPVIDNPVRWKDTKDNQQFVKKWAFEANDKECVIDIINVINDYTDTISRFTVEVFELPPTANIECLTQPITGHSPFTVQLSPSGCRSGSFPIERIDWDFGDGSPIKSVTKYFSLTSDPDLIFSNIFPGDVSDVRNFNVKHTYFVNKDVYPVFYPSLTCYSANTNTSDACTTTIGPVFYPSTPQDLQLIKSKNTTKGILYAFNTNKNIVFTTTNNVNTNKNEPPIPNKPNNPFKNFKNLLQLGTGNNGIYNTGQKYPEPSTITCTLCSIINYNRLVTESGNTPPPDEDGPDIPIKTESILDIIP